MNTPSRHYKRSLVWFTQDLRLHDNPVLTDAHECSEAILHCVFVGEVLRPITTPGIGQPSEKRRQFLYQGIEALRRNLWEHGQQLLVLPGTATQHLSALIDRYRLDAVFRADRPGFDEAKAWNQLRRAYPQISFQSVANQGLFKADELPFSLAEMPKQFTPFRKQIEASSTQPRALASLPLWRRPLPVETNHTFKVSNELSNTELLFEGGESAGRKHLNRYFSSECPSTYKQTRNALMGFDTSTKLSPWLAQGSLSPSQVYQALKRYELDHGANDSTYWIYFELLWREFFLLRGRLEGSDLFRKRGRKESPPLSSFYPDRFKSWCEGTTPEPLVNACMKELKQTGFMSNRGRQIAASYLVNELNIDWRYGASYFEQHLLDYEVGSNWGNWQYLAGVGADPRGRRRFDINKQSRQFDPTGEYVRRWKGSAEVVAINQRDAADWPIMPS